MFLFLSFETIHPPIEIIDMRCKKAHFKNAQISHIKWHVQVVPKIIPIGKVFEEINHARFCSRKYQRIRHAVCIIDCSEKAGLLKIYISLNLCFPPYSEIRHLFSLNTCVRISSHPNAVNSLGPTLIKSQENLKKIARI